LAITRETIWRNQRGDVVQVSCAILTDWWDPLYEVTKNVGPFDCPPDIAQDARTDCQAWYRLHGEQPSLWDEPSAP
jgi:hypothetical protein